MGRPELRHEINETQNGGGAAKVQADMTRRASPTSPAAHEPSLDCEGSTHHRMADEDGC
eukprot:CAMPEP_0180360764 /NCGR_PEP_ID=MMETSP0989-20121125/12177_1 /TAXON_ID=697907 /ORGANISM="non described non described, Strain CCMP2293" /LENGTH=58 /DNA_ID=CAMNT_0022352177 /DNA_START=66 /DNA_END=242 /DNA_ORIENTATION=+